MKFTKSQLKQVILETLKEEKQYAADPSQYRDQIVGKIANQDIAQNTILAINMFKNDE